MACTGAEWRELLILFAEAGERFREGTVSEYKFTKHRKREDVLWPSMSKSYCCKNVICISAGKARSLDGQGKGFVGRNNMRHWWGKQGRGGWAL